MACGNGIPLHVHTDTAAQSFPFTGVPEFITQNISSVLVFLAWENSTQSSNAESRTTTKVQGQDPRHLTVIDSIISDICLPKSREGDVYFADPRPYICAELNFCTWAYKRGRRPLYHVLSLYPVTSDNVTLFSTQGQCMAISDILADSTNQIEWR